MKSLFVFVSFMCSFCEGSKFLCQSYDASTKSLEKYCINYNGTVPANCLNEVYLLEPSDLLRLKIGGCNYTTLLRSIVTFPSVHHLDVSYSNIDSLNWLDRRLDQLVTLNVSNNNISDHGMPWRIFERNFPQIREIDFSHNRLNRIDSGLFGKVEKLVKVHLSHNNLSAVEPFENSNNLKHIDLSNNRLTKIPAFFNDRNFQRIHLDENPISTFQCIGTSMVFISWKYVTTFNGDPTCNGKQFHIVRNDSHESVITSSDQRHELHCNEQSFENLRYFTAGANAFFNVSDALHLFGPSIWDIDLSGNYLTGQLTNTTFNRFDLLNKLILSDTKLTHFQLNQVENQKRLWTLDISSNTLNALGNISLLENFLVLHEFNASDNHLANATEIIQNLRRSVVKLDLSGSSLRNLNANMFQRLVELETLHLIGCDLLIGDQNPFEPLQSLKILDISRNNLANVNFAVLSPTLGKLIEFRAAYCQIKDISEVVQHLGPSLKKLDLTGNVIKTIHNRAFDRLTNLMNLVLREASITYFDPGSLQNQRDFMKLDLSHNKLHEINVGSISDNLRDLNLEGNDLIDIKSFSPAHFRSLKSLAIAKNQLDCPHLKRLKKDFQEVHFIGEPLDQQQFRDCRTSSQGINDFLGSVYNKLKIW